VPESVKSRPAPDGFRAFKKPQTQRLVERPIPMLSEPADCR